MQTTQNVPATQNIEELLLEMHMRVSVSIGCAYGLMSMFHEMDVLTEITCSGLTFSLNEIQSIIERLEEEYRRL